jgi:GTPase Era involved in 16S rRNA processing
VSGKGSAVKPNECGNIATESHRSITLGKKMEVIRRIRVQTRPDVCVEV